MPGAMCIILFNLYKTLQGKSDEYHFEEKKNKKTTRVLKKLNYLPQTYADGKRDLEFSQSLSDTEANMLIIRPVLAMVVVGT